LPAQRAKKKTGGLKEKKAKAKKEAPWWMLRALMSRGLNAQHRRHSLSPIFRLRPLGG
jgi:hypothetical protein